MLRSEQSTALQGAPNNKDGGTDNEYRSEVHFARWLFDVRWRDARAGAGKPTTSKSTRSRTGRGLDECDPVTFNAALGPDFCRNVTLGAFTTLSDLFAKAAAGTPDPGWDFEPDTVHIKKGTSLSVVDQGGEPHTFTEVAQFGGGFITGAQCARRGHGSRMCRRLFESRGGQNSNPSRQRFKHHGSV